MLHREFWTGYKRGEGVKFGGGRECLCYRGENSQPFPWLMNEFREWNAVLGCHVRCHVLCWLWPDRGLYSHLCLPCFWADPICSPLCGFAQHCMKLIRMTYNLYEMKLFELNTTLDVHESACRHMELQECMYHQWLIFCLYTFVHCVLWTSSSAETAANTFPAWPVPKQNRKITSLWFSPVVIVLPPWLPNCLFPPLI